MLSFKSYQGYRASDPSERSESEMKDDRMELLHYYTRMIPYMVEIL